MKKSLIWYVVIIGVFASLSWIVIDKGSLLLPKNKTSLNTVTPVVKMQDKTKPVVTSENASVFSQFINNIKSPLSLLLLQIIVVLIASRVFGILATKIGQPSVVGEIFAGIFLGPSIIGMYFPEFSGFLFPKDSLKSLQFLSQIGLAFFMFIIGMELDIGKLKNKTHDAVVVSHASIIFPYFLGVLLSYFIYESFAPAGVSFLAFSLFMGIAMSITAFPVLARILQERGLTKTPLGVMAITCAAADDVTAWCILAAVITVVKAGSMVSSIFTIVLALLFVIGMLYAIKPAMRKFTLSIISKEKLDKTLVAVSFFIMLLSAYFAEIIGIHALFGAFLAGVIMPQNVKFKEQLTEKIEDISVMLLLPIFFAFTGLRTQIGLLNQSHLWLTCILIIAVAVIGKFLGSALSAKMVGQTWKNSLSIGALMNTRGLMELIVLNIGYDLGILSPEIFAILVLMALSTTFMTGPALNIINRIFKEKEPSPSLM
jgi:Kef-type K+ transport system membrane component KefB